MDFEKNQSPDNTDNINTHDSDGQSVIGSNNIQSSPQQPNEQPFSSLQQPQQTSDPTPQPNSATQSPSPGLIILQWLTYAFWGWTVLALSALTASVLANLLGDVETGGFTPYGIAAVLVLLPISFVCDVFYTKHEPEKKTGASMLVMVIHVVLFALFGIGSLIFAVFSMLQLVTSSSDSTGAQIALYSSLIIASFYLMTFLRTLNPARIPWIRRAFKAFMLVFVGIIILLAATGPIARERATRDDRLISRSLPTLQSAIISYAKSKDKLPADLNDLDLPDGDARQLVERNLVKYTQKNVGSGFDDSASRFKSSTRQVYYYELCVNYKEESRNYGLYGSSRYEDSDEYSLSVSSYSHPAGNACYKLRTYN